MAGLETSGHDLGGARILVLDDEEGVRRIVRRMLGECNCRVVEAADGFDGLVLLERDPAVDLVLTDLSMPRVGGLAVVQRVAVRYPGMPVVVMSGNGAAMAAAPQIPVLRKPFTASELLGTLALHLASRSRGVADPAPAPAPPRRAAPRSRYRSPPR
ncbi:MAG: response regulator [Gemmatimonadota bacterium]